MRRDASRIHRVALRLTLTYMQLSCKKGYPVFQRAEAAMTMIHAEKDALHEVAAPLPPADLMGRILATVPALCFVHCVGATVLALALPTVASLSSAGEWLEAPLWLLSLLVVGMMLLRRGMARSGAAALFGLALTIGTLGFLKDLELAKRVSLLLLIGLQVLSWRQSRRPAVVPACVCHGQRIAA